MESESTDNTYYFIRYNPSSTFEWCSCLDNSNRDLKCKHRYAIDFAIKWGTIKDVDKQLLHSFVKRDNNTATIPPNIVGEDAEYDF